MELNCEQNRLLIWYCFKRRLTPSAAFDELRTSLEEQAPSWSAHGQQKSRYIVWDIETFALNQQSGKGRQVPHLLIAATTCYNCLNGPFIKQICATCEGHHKTRECISNEAWKIDNTHVKVSCWVNDIGHSCEECRQQQLTIRSGQTKVLFKVLFTGFLRDN